MEFLNNLPDWIYGVVALVVVAGFIIGKQNKDKNPGSGKPNKANIAYIPMDDSVTEGNGPQEIMFHAAMAMIFGKPVAIGATQSKRGTGAGFVNSIINGKMKLGIPVKEGAKRYGSNQGHSPLSREIVKWAKKGPLSVSVGGKWTDVAIALRKNPEIKKNLKVFAIGGSNKDTGSDDYKFVANSGVHLEVLEPDRYSLFLKSMSPGEADNWLKQVVLPVAGGKETLRGPDNPAYGKIGGWWDENIRNNDGKFKIATPLRASDFLATMRIFGVNIRDTGGIRRMMEEGFSRLPKAK